MWVKCRVAVVLAKYDDVSFSKSLGTVVTERLVDTFVYSFDYGTYLSGSDVLCFSVSFRKRVQKFLR